MTSKKRPAIWIPGKMIIGMSGVFCLFNVVLGFHPSWYYLSGLALQGFGLFFFMLSIPALVLVHRGRMKRDGEIRSSSGGLVATGLVVFALCMFIFALPLRVGFFFGAKSGLEEVVHLKDDGRFQPIDEDVYTPFYSFSADRTNWRLESKWNRRRLLFIMKNDSESAFIYAPEGIKTLAYNSGRCGHLLGDWYWMKED